MATRGAAWFALLLALCHASSAQAQGADLVLLQNGGRLRGTIEQYEPGQPLVVMLPDGTRRTLAPDEVASVQFADAAAPSPPVPVPTPAATAAPTPLMQPIAPTPTAPAPPGPAFDRDRDRSTDGPTIQDISPTAGGDGSWGQPAFAMRSFGDGHASAAWDNPESDPLLRPTGPFHLGVELMGGLLPLDFGTSRPVIGFGELGIVLQVRLARAVSLRVVPMLHLATTGATRLYRSYYGNVDSSDALLAFGGRILFSFDLVPVVALRIGGLLAGEYFDTGVVSDIPRGGGELGLAFRPDDEQRLEIGVLARFVYMNGWSTPTDASTVSSIARRDGSAGLEFGLSVGYLFL